MAEQAAVGSRPAAAEMRCLEPDAWHFGQVQAWNPGLLPASARTAISRRRFQQTAKGAVEPSSRCLEIDSSIEPRNGVHRTALTAAGAAFTV